MAGGNSEVLRKPPQSPFIEQSPPVDSREELDDKQEQGLRQNEIRAQVGKRAAGFAKQPPPDGPKNSVPKTRSSQIARLGREQRSG